MLRLWLSFLLLAACACAADQERVVTSIIPSLDYGPACWSSLTLTNLADRIVTVEVEAHREGGGLVGLADLSPATLHLDPGERSTHRLEIADESGQGWLKVRERIPEPKLSPAIAVSAVSECTIHDRLLTTPRQLSYPTRNPWFSGDIDEMHGNVISLVNTSERARTGIAVLLGRQSVFGAHRRPSSSRAFAGVFQRVRRADTALCGAAISSGARGQQSLLDQDAGRGHRSADAPPGGKRRQSLQSGFEHHLRR